jgi:hypothetical protein
VAGAHFAGLAFIVIGVEHPWPVAAAERGALHSPAMDAHKHAANQARVSGRYATTCRRKPRFRTHPHDVIRGDAPKSMPIATDDSGENNI